MYLEYTHIVQHHWVLFSKFQFVILWQAAQMMEKGMVIQTTEPIKLEGVGQLF